MKFYTREEVSQLTYKECQATLKWLATTYDLEKPLSEYPEVMPVVDDIANTMLYCEDRIWEYENPVYSLTIEADDLEELDVDQDEQDQYNKDCNDMQ